jgi:hypothetical protein
MERAKQLTLTMVVLAVALLLPAAAKADPLVLTLDPVHTVAAGASVTFQGTFSNGGAPGRFVNAVGFTFSGGFSDFTFDPSAFFAAVPAFVNPGFTTGPPGPFFDILVSSSAAPGNYTGSFSVLGGDTDSSNSVLATKDFSLIVQAGQGQVVPEPATLLLLGTGLAGAALARRRKQKQNAC